ncbi:MAG: sugar transferase, partial [Fidelibacterota bacterium]
GAWLAPSGRRFLRELPLLFAIVSGKMSFVGSPLVPVSSGSARLLCKPGLTGLDRIKKLNLDSSDRAVFEHYYVQHQSMAFDLEILLRTLFAL